MNVRRLKQALVVLTRWLKPAVDHVAPLVSLRDVFVFGGVALVSNGLGMVYPPAAWIFSGLVILWLGVR